MRRLLISAAVIASLALPSAALASSYPTQGLANQTIRSWVVSKAGPCGDGTTWTCSGNFSTNCFGTVGNNAMYCYGQYEEQRLYNPFSSRYCTYDPPTRVGKVSEGVARVVFYGGDNCHTRAFYP